MAVFYFLFHDVEAYNKTYNGALAPVYIQYMGCSSRLFNKCVCVLFWMFSGRTPLFCFSRVELFSDPDDIADSATDLCAGLREVACIQFS